MVGVFELFKIGVGPSSSHTVGPMLAARRFALDLAADGFLDATAGVSVTLLGSLAWTGRGHASDRAAVLGLAGASPEAVDAAQTLAVMARVSAEGRLALLGRHDVPFDPARAIVFDTVTRPERHPNTLRLDAVDARGTVLLRQGWCSVGGGFVQREDGPGAAADPVGEGPFAFRSGAELLGRGAASGLSIAAMVQANEDALRGPGAAEAHVDRVVAVMMDCIDRGLAAEGELPGGLGVRRRARGIAERLAARRGANARPGHEVLDRVSLYALAVNEENAAGGRVVTAPTNGAAGVIPAVLRHYRDGCGGADPDGTLRFMLTAAAVGALFKMNASISGAEVGCQGEVGVASSMAAAGLCAALGGTNAQIENAAEIAMEHHLGMTCDPIGGLVQIPCIERNAFGAVKAVTAASLALHGDGVHRVSLDHVVATMRRTGADMSANYKETSLGGLAVNFIEC